MALPVQSIRARPEHRETLQRVANLLREGSEPALRKIMDRVEEQPIGPFINEDAAIGFLRDRLVATLRPKAIWLFGSRATGRATPNSDIDLLVVLPDDLDEDAYSYHRVSEPAAASGLPYDIIPCAWSTFERDKVIAGSLVERATSEGRLIYLDRELRAQARAA
jgi:predicted nucleotidyltransferase